MSVINRAARGYRYSYRPATSSFQPSSTEDVTSLLLSFTCPDCGVTPADDLMEAIERIINCQTCVEQIAQCEGFGYDFMAVLVHEHGERVIDVFDTAVLLATI